MLDVSSFKLLGLVFPAPDVPGDWLAINPAWDKVAQHDGPDTVITALTDLMCTILQDAFKSQTDLDVMYAPNRQAREACQLILQIGEEVDTYTLFSDNTCEHGDHAAPHGKRFCSEACKECEDTDNTYIPSHATHAEGDGSLHRYCKTCNDCTECGDCHCECAGICITKQVPYVYAVRWRQFADRDYYVWEPAEILEIKRVIGVYNADLGVLEVGKP